MKISRRKFLGSSAAAVIVAGTLAKGKVFGANERVPVAVIGIHGQGNSHIEQMLKMDNVEIVALCDVDSRVLDGRASAVERNAGKAPKKYVDLRDLMADDSVAAISTATPNHWHGLIGVWACQAKKHAYIEKPMVGSFWEGPQLIAAAKQANVVVMHGTQQRSNAAMIRDMRLMHEQKVIGDIVMARGVVYKNGNRGPIGHGVPAGVPEWLDYNLWQGPAQEKPYLATEEDPNEGLFVHYDWHWFWQWGNGEIGNQGVHEMDVACWAIDKGLPVKVYSSGGRYGWDDDGETPNTQSSTFTYADGTMLEFEVRNMGSFHEADAGACTNSAFGTNGYWVRGKGFFEYRENKPIAVEAEEPASAGPFGNFINAILSGKPEDNFASPEVAFPACAHIDLANIAFRLGRSLDFDPAAGKFVNAPDADSMLKRDYRDPFVMPQLA